MDVNIQEAPNDKVIIDLLAECFDRDAFKIPFAREVSMPDFHDAVKDTIAALNTGVRKLPGGNYERIYSRHKVKDPKIKKQLSIITALLSKLGNTYVDFVKTKNIIIEGESMGITLYNISPDACTAIDKIKDEIFNRLKEINPGFEFTAAPDSKRRKKSNSIPIIVPGFFTISKGVRDLGVKLNMLQKKLGSDGYIEKDLLEGTFKNLFVVKEAVLKPKSIITPVPWKKSLPELHDLLAYLKRRKIMIEADYIWMTTAKLFTDKEGKPLDYNDIRDMHLKKDIDAKKIEKLEKIVNNIFPLPSVAG